MSEANWFRAEVRELFGTQAAMARFMVGAGDHRDYETILRNISNAATGVHRVRGELRVILTLMRASRKSADEWLRLVDKNR